MPVHHWIPYLFAATTVVGAGSAAVYTALTPPPEPVTQQDQARVIPGPALAPAPKAAPDSLQAPALKEAARPSFDVVRIESDGNGVIAGRAEPGWKVTIGSGDDEIAQAIADRNGEWAVVLDAPLPPGEHSIGLRARAPEGNRGFVSDQNVAISIAGTQQPGQAIVALSQPGSATRLLTPAEPSPIKQEPRAREDTAVAAPVQKEKFQIANAGKIASSPEQDPAAQPTAVATNKPVPAAMPEIVVSFDAVDYELSDNGKGKLFLSGQAEAGARVTLYLDNRLVGEAVAASDGTWTLESLRTLPPDKLHTMRADARQSDGQVASRAEVPFTPPPKPANIAASPEMPKELPRREAKEETQPAAVASDRDATGSITDSSAMLKATTTAPEAMTPKPEVSTPAPAPAAAAKPQQETPKKDTVVAAAPEPAAPPAMSPPVERQAPANRPAVAGSAPATNQPAPIAVEPVQAPAKQAEEAVVVAAAEPAPKPATVVKVDLLSQKRSIVVRRGDTLWHIARRRYGRGIRYTAIYRNNRDQIRNPHLIYPGQEFRLPVR